MPSVRQRDVERARLHADWRLPPARLLARATPHRLIHRLALWPPTRLGGIGETKSRLLVLKPVKTRRSPSPSARHAVPAVTQTRGATESLRAAITSVMAHTSDDTLLRRAAGGDTDAFGELFQRHARRVFSFCFRQTGDWSLADDLTSIAFLEAWRRRTAAVEDGMVVAWLLGVAFNVVKRRRRAAFRYRRALDRLPTPPVVEDHADETTARVSAEREVAALLPRLRQLPKREQEVLALVGWEGLSTVEAAVALDMPEATVRSHLYRARQRLQPSGWPDVPPPSPPPVVPTSERT